MIRIGSALSRKEDPAAAVEEAAGRALEALDGRPPGLVLNFHSVHHATRMHRAAERLAEMAAGAAVIGCTTQAVVGDSQEVENGPALAVWAAHIPTASFRPFSLSVEDGPEGPEVTGLPEPGPESRALIMLGDPFTFPSPVLAEINEMSPRLPVIGGLASGGMGPGRHALILGSDVRTSGAVGVLVEGGIRIETVVAQGCRPIGSPYVVTAAEGNVIFQLAGQPPLERLREVIAKLAPEERLLVNNGVHVGLAIDEYKARFEHGDFLIRGLIGADEETGAIAVGDLVSVGQTVQFHLRDASTADEDLLAMLKRHAETLDADPGGGLLFTCNGRGASLFGEPHHDIGRVESSLGPLPVAGMFCAGELGPVGGKNFLHGFTASLALFMEPEEG